MTTMKKICEDAVKILKNNYSHRKTNRLPKSEQQNYRDFMIGIYNRLDEVGLIYSAISGISFNEAVEKLDMKDVLDELKDFLKIVVLTGNLEEKR